MKNVLQFKQEQRRENGKALDGGELSSFITLQSLATPLSTG